MMVNDSCTTKKEDNYTFLAIEEFQELSARKLGDWPGERHFFRGTHNVRNNFGSIFNYIFYGVRIED